MKRSRHIALVGMGVSALALSACDNAPKEFPGSIYSSFEQCKASGVHTAAQCQAAFEKAIDIHETDAKRFATKSECEAEYGAGQCQKAPSEDGQSRFRSGFTAFFLGGLAANSSAQPLYPAKPGETGFRTANNAFVNSTGGKAVLNRQAMARPTTVARAGFGATAAKTADAGKASGKKSSGG